MQQTLQRKPMYIINYTHFLSVERSVQSRNTYVSLNTAREHNCTNTCAGKASKMNRALLGRNAILLPLGKKGDQ